MPMSQIASRSPTPMSTRRVMITGLIGPDLRERTVGLVHRTTTAQDLSYGILPKNLAYPTDGRVRTVLHLSRAAHDSVPHPLHRTGTKEGTRQTDVEIQANE